MLRPFFITLKADTIRLLFYSILALLYLLQPPGMVRHCMGSQIAGTAFYDMELQIYPEKQFISVRGSLRFPACEVPSGQFALYLHRQLNIHSFSLNNREVFEVDNSPSDILYMPEAKKIILSPTDPDPRDDYLNIAFTYSGNITKNPEWLANSLSEEWVELGGYFPWFPLCFGLRTITYRISINISESYTVFAVGEYSAGNNLHIFQSALPNFDIVVCAAKDLKIRTADADGNRFNLVYFSLDDLTADTLIKDVDLIYRFFNEKFGRVEGSISLVESKRKMGGGYSRPGGLYLPGFADADYFEYRKGYHRYLAHEISHNWWRLADPTTWHDWLNESFAEYSALMFLRHLHGVEEYSKELDRYRAEIKTTPPLWGLDRNHPLAHKVLYQKGPVILEMLENRLGEDTFSALCLKLIKRQVSTTESFLDLLEEMAENETGKWFESLLREY